METIVGKIVKVFKTSGAWSSCVVAADDGEIINCAGTIPGAVEGMRIKAVGCHKNHPRFGPQFNVEQCDLEVDYTFEYAQRYLYSGAVKGVGPETARKILEKFGADSIRIIESDDYLQLTSIDKIGPKTAKIIHDSCNENSAYRKLLGYANLSYAQADKLYRAYQGKALEMIKEHPYQIIYDVDGFGFKTVDDIALKNGHKPDSRDRIAAAITYQLTQIGDNGHCYCTIDALEENLNNLIPNIDNETRSNILVGEIENGHVVVEGDNSIYAKRLYDAETNIANNLAEMLRNNTGEVPQRDIDKAVMDMELEVGFELEEHQKQAVSMALRNRVSIITGGPGTGKSTIVNAIVKGWMTKFPKGANPRDCVLLCAPTGKASRRMSEVTGIYAETVQRILARQRRDDAELIAGKLIIVDESSMLDILLADAVVRLAKIGNNRLVLIGDINQLPPIGPGNFFRDMVNSPCIPSVTLRLCHRQSGTIAINAKRINDGNGYSALNFDHVSCQFVYADKENARASVIEEYRNLLSQYDVRDICIIVPMRKAGRSQTSAEDLNEIIREEVNPELPGEPKLEGCKFREGDRVMYTTNDYEKEIFNGDCGVIQEIDPVLQIIYLEMDDKRIVELTVHEAIHLILAYAITVHKSQGSEYKGIVIAHNREHAFMLQRNLLYTAITRAKEQVVIVGEPEAINMAIKKIPSLERQTKLKMRIGKAVVNHRS